MYLPGPNFDLNLEWVYGFRSEKCRNNVRSISSSEIVYFVECLGVVFNIKCRQQRFYFDHTENILCLAVHPLKYVVATGQMGKRPYICVWDPITMETVSILKDGHPLGISAMDFNSDGQKLASVGFGQNSSIIIWNWKAGRVLTKFEDQSFYQTFFIRFSPFESGRLITGGLKSFNFWKLSDSNYLEKECPKDWETIASVDAQTMLCAIFASNGLIYSGSLSGDIYVWKSESLDSVMKNVHRGGVTVINCDEDGTFLTAGKDGQVQLWTIDMKPKSRIDLSIYTKGQRGVQIRVAEFSKFSVLVGTAENKIYEVQSQPHYNIECILQGPSASSESQALAIHPQRLLFVDGTKDGFLRLWTIFERNLLNEINVGVGINCCHFRPQGNHLAVGTCKAGIIIHRFPDLETVLSINDLIDNLWVLKYSPDGIYLAVGKSDGCIIYNVYKNYTKVNDISGCKTPPLHLDWSSNSDHIQIVDINYQHYVFRVHDGRLINEQEVNKLMWSSWTCPTGRDIAGAWPKYSQDLKHVTSVDVNLETNLALTGHKKGQLQLHNFPKHDFGESRVISTGHSSKIANIQFVHDKSRVISVSENGKAIFQWTVSGQNIRHNLYQVEFFPKYEILNDIVEDEFTLDCEIAREIQLFHQCIQNKSNKDIKEFKSVKGRDGFRQPPNEGLQLQYVFGHRSYDCRNNIYFSSMGKIVYHVAALGVVLNPTENKQKFYFGHTDDILCICVSSINDVAATGQVGNQIHVWDVKSLLTLSILEESDNCKAILGISFSRNGIHLLSRSNYQEGQKITIWDWQNGQTLAQSEFISYCLMMISWHSINERKLISVGVNHLRFWNRLGNGFNYREVKFDGKTISKTETLLCAAAYLSNPDEDHYITGSSSGNVYEWNNCILLKTVKAHDGPVFCLSFLENGFMSGGKDGVVHLWDDNFKHAIRTFPVLKSYAICKGSNRVYMCKDRPAIKACDMRQGTIVIGTADGDIILMENNGYFTVANQIHPAHKINGLDVHPYSNKLVTYGEDMTIRTWDLDTYQLVTCKALFRLGSCVAYSTDGVFIAAGHSDGSVEILNSNSLDTLEIIHNKTSAVVTMKFSPKPNGFLAIGHEDGFVDVFTSSCPWRWKNTCDSKNIPIVRLNWDEKGNLLFIFTSGNRLAYEIPSGIEVIFPFINSQQPDYHSVLCNREFPNYKWDLAHNLKLIAIAHKSAILKLMNGPTKAIDSANKWYIGHGRIIGDLKWTFNDEILVTVNNSGAAILLWNKKMLTTERKINYDSDESDNERPDEDIDCEIDEEMNAIHMYKQQRFEEILKSKQFAERVSNGGREKLLLEKEWKKSCQVPKQQLEFAFGYNGRGFGNNLHYLAANGTTCIVYPVSSTAVIFNTITNFQSHYNNHTDFITALVLNHHLDYTDIVASAQLTDEPAVHVWSYKTLQNISMLSANTTKSNKCHSGFRSLCFSENGLLLLGLEYNSNILLWNWTEGNLLIQTEAISRSIIFDIKFRPNSNHEMVSVGKRHVKFWTIAGSKLVSRKGVDAIVQDCNESTRMKTMLSVSFGKGDIAFTGGVDGKIYEWKKFFLQRIIVEAHAGPIFTMHLSLYDGLIISGSKNASNSSGGDENVVKMWDPYMTKCKPFSIGDNVVVKAVDRFMGKLLIGTNDNCIYELNEKTGAVHKILNSSIGKIYNAVCHPKQSIVATVDESKTLRIWDVKRRKMKRKLKLSYEIKCLDFDGEGEIIVLGSSEGHIYIIDAMTMSTICQKRDYVFPMKSIRVSSENQYLANLFEDGTVNIYTESERWKHLKRVGYWLSDANDAIGYSRIDFSKDSKYLAIFRHNITEILVLALPTGYKVTNFFLNEWINQTFSLGKLLEKNWLAFVKEGNCQATTCLAMSKDKSLVAVGTNKGNVGFIPFPITKSEIIWNKSHHSIINGIDFMHDKSSAVTVSTNCMKIWNLMFDHT